MLKFMDGHELHAGSGIKFLAPSAINCNAGGDPNCRAPGSISGWLDRFRTVSQHYSSEYLHTCTQSLNTASHHDAQLH